jgi:hypothetical protein
MILMGSGMGLLIEAWKVRMELLFAYPHDSDLGREQITKAVDIKIVASQPGSLLPWQVVFAGRSTSIDGVSVSYQRPR